MDAIHKILVPTDFPRTPTRRSAWLTRWLG
jgi:hypothetical protein